MLTGIIDWSLRHGGLVLLATAGLVIAGVLSFRALPIDAFPDTTPAQVQINAVAPALGPVEIERQLTVPIEQAVAGLPHVEEMRSISKFGLSQVTVRFRDGTDIWFARQVVAERLGSARLPDTVERPTLGPVATGLGEVFHYLVTGEGKSLEELRTIQDWVIAPQLRSVAGVAEINAWGGAEKQWHVIVDPRRLQMFGLSLKDVYRAIETNNANVGGGVIERAGGARLVLGVGVIGDGRQLADIVVASRDGVPILIRDVANVEIGHEIRRGATTADGRGEVVLGLAFMLMGENSHEVTRALAARLHEIAKTLPQGVLVEPVYERTDLVGLVLATVEKNLFEGALLVIAVLFVFLGNLRAGLIVAAAIPLSMLFAFSAMLRFGIAGTLMSLGAIDFGLIVDSSVIMIENAERRLAAATDKRSVLEIVRDAAIEVRKPTLFGELIIMVVYLPILTLEGVEGKLFRPMAMTVIFALLGSAVLSMTLMPVLASLVLQTGGAHGRREPRLVVAAKRVYEPVLNWALAHARTVLTLAVLLVAAAVFAGARLGSEFVPRLSEGTLVINTVRLAEVSLTESLRVGGQIEAVILAKFPDEVRRVWTRTGTAEVATDPMGIELSDVFITLAPRDQWKRARTQDELVVEIKAELADLPGMRMAFLQPIEMRVNEMIAGVRSDLGIKLFGDDLDVLKATARQIEAAIRGIDGAADVTVEQITGQPVLEIAADRAAIARHGIAVADVLDVVDAVGTRHAGEVREGDRRFEISVRLAEDYRDDPAKLGTVLVPAPGGERIPLAQLVTMREVSGPTTIQREWGKRRVVVQANVRGRDLGSFVDEVREVVDREVTLPAGYYVRFGGQFENLERAQARLVLVVPIALTLIFLLLYATYQRVVDALRIFAGVPFALVGGVLALLIRGMPFSISAAVGFVALSGVSVLGDMVLVSRVRQLLDRGMDLEPAIREAALSRLRPVLMTAAVASLGFVPMALSTGVGAEVQRPLATVVIGGVISSTLLTLVVLPVLYSLFGASGAAARATAEHAPASGAPKQRALGCVTLLALGLLAQRVEAAEPFTLARALERARAANPDLLAARQEVDIARARLVRAEYLSQFNPEIAGEASHRRVGPGESGADLGVALSQELEVGGQRGKRIAEARANLERVEQVVADRARLVDAEVKEAFFSALARGRRHGLLERVEELNRRVRDAAQARVKAGDIPRMEADFAEIRFGQSRKETIAAERDYAVAVLGLKRAVGMPAEMAAEPVGELRTSPVPHALGDLFERARRARPDLEVGRREVARVDAETALERRLRIPNPTLEGFYREEPGDGGRERIAGVGLRIPLPVFDRRQAELAALGGRRRQAQFEVDATVRQVETEVAEALQDYEAAQREIAVFEQDVLARAEENLRSLETAYQAGKIDFFQLVVVQGDLVEAQLSYLDSLAAFRAAEVALERAVGSPM
jgi:cobalt-zinc-cadmium resistance protein CzcA